MKRAFLVLSFLLISGAARAVETDKPVGFSADDLTYNRELNLIVARGNVMFTQGKSTLKADNVSYSPTDDTVIASGNVEIYTPDGGLMQANYTRLSGEMKEGLVSKIRYTLSDKSVLTAKEAQHIRGNFTQFEDVAYSSCDFCKDGSRFWEIKADKMTHDREKHDMTAYNAIMTVKDVPLMYVPYFTYPDPTVKRRSGLLMPSIKSNRAMGFGVIVPYYQEISPYTDVTLSPWLAANGVLMSGQIRHNFSQGSTELKGSFIDDRYSFEGFLNWDISDVWRFKTNIDYASDDTYLRRYDLRDDYAPWLTSDAGFEALTSDVYFYAGGAYYRNMRANVNDDTVPRAFPLMTFAQNTDADFGGYWSVGASSAVLTRKIGDDSSRLSLEGGYHLPGIADWGAAYSFDATALVNGYKVKDYIYVKDGRRRTFDGDVASFHPQASLKVSYPFVSVGERVTQILEPVVMGVVAPNTQPSDKIPNEDSNDLDFDDTNLFSEKRFVGYDRYEAGSRVNYGIQWSAYGKNGGHVSALIGQSYRFSNREEFPVDSGLYDRTSDLVGRIALYPNSFLNLSYAFRMDRKTYALNRSSLSLGVGNALLRADVSYMYLKSRLSSYSDYDTREEITYTLTSHLTRYWSVKFYQRVNLSDGGGVLETGGYARYEDECFAIETGIEKEYTYDRDYQNGVSFKLGLEFKPFGIFNL